jgi:hypothetical protein
MGLAAQDDPASDDRTHLARRSQQPRKPSLEPTWNPPHVWASHLLCLDPNANIGGWFRLKDAVS